MQDILSAYAQTPAIASEMGYEMKTTYWGDFTVAEKLDGISGVKDTFKRAFKCMKDDEVYITEMYMVANWKVWQHYENNMPLAKAYQDICDTIDKYVLDGDNWTKEQKAYFIKTTD